MPNMKSLTFITLGMMFAFSGMFAALTVTVVLAADAYPSKPLRFVLPMPPGGTADMFTRMIAAHLSERLGRQVIVDNCGGAGGIIGTELVAKAEPDGHTLLLVQGLHATQAALQKLPYDPTKSFTLIAKLGYVPYALIIHSSVPANSLKELIALAKQKPGQLIFVTAGLGASAHMGTELLKILIGIDIKIVHFKGGAPAMTDLLGGHSHAVIGSLPQYLPHIRSGKLRVLGTSGTKRNFVLPDVPTIAEAAGLPGYQLTNWWGILAPAGAPEPIVDRLNIEIKAILAADEVKKWFLSEGAEMEYLGPPEFGKFLEREIATWARVVKEANIKLE